MSATFSKPNAPDGKGPPASTWIFASNGEAANVDVYDAKTLKMISQCTCTGVGLAVAPRSGDLAVGTRSETVTVWHVKRNQIALFATLNLSQGPYAIGLAFDKNGDLYAANAGDNVIDFFTASEIASGGGTPARTLVTSHLSEVEYLAASAHALLADGYNNYGQPFLVSVNTRTGADTVLQQITSGTVPEGIAFDRHENLILNTVGDSNTLAVFKKPWSGSPSLTFVYGSAPNGYYTGISLNKPQNNAVGGQLLSPGRVARLWERPGQQLPAGKHRAFVDRHRVGILRQHSRRSSGEVTAAEARPGKSRQGASAYRRNARDGGMRV